MPTNLVSLLLVTSDSFTFMLVETKIYQGSLCSLPDGVKSSDFGHTSTGNGFPSVLSWLPSATDSASLPSHPEVLDYEEFLNFNSRCTDSLPVPS